MSCSIVWGILLILLGAGLVVKFVFNLDIPVFKIILGVFIIYIGIKVITGGSWNICRFENEKGDVIFGEARINSTDDWPGGERNVIFGASVIDLSKMALGDSTVSGKLKINTIFGSTRLILPKDQPVKIHLETAFAGAMLPDGSKASFGNSIYQSATDSSGKNPIEIHASVVFGSLRAEVAK